MLISGNPDTEAHVTSTVKFIVILCILWYIINFRFPPIHGWESLIVVNFYDCNYQNVNMYHRIAITFYSRQLFIC